MARQLLALKRGFISFGFGLCTSILAMAPVLFLLFLLPAMLVACVKLGYLRGLKEGIGRGVLSTILLGLQSLLTPLFWLSLTSYKLIKNPILGFIFGVQSTYQDTPVDLFLTFEQEIDRANTTLLFTFLRRIFLHLSSNQSSNIHGDMQVLWLITQSLILFSNEMLFDPMEKNQAIISKIKPRLLKSLQFMQKYSESPFFSSLKRPSMEVLHEKFTTEPLLTELELATLKTKSSYICLEEERYYEQTVHNLLQRYEQLIHLKDNICPILKNKPKCPILLSKQYLKDKQWINVPHYSFVFDKDALKWWYQINPVLDPLMVLNQTLFKLPIAEPLHHPFAYKTYPTRFRYEHFNAANNQELNELVYFMRYKLLRSRPMTLGATSDVRQNQPKSYCLISRTRLFTPNSSHQSSFEELPNQTDRLILNQL